MLLSCQAPLLLTLCLPAVSGTVPEEPVINRNSGLLFEKRLVEKHVQVHCSPLSAPHLLLHCLVLLISAVSHTCACVPQETGKDPITGEAASLDDLVAVKTNKVCTGGTLPADCVEAFGRQEIG